MADTSAEKLWVQQNVNLTAINRALEVMQNTSLGVLPCSVVAVIGSMVTVNFEVTGPQTLPQIMIPKAESQWVRTPTQVGDFGLAAPCGTFLGGVSGLGSGVADTTVNYGNLTTLVFLPIASVKFGDAPSGDQPWINGPGGAFISDTAQTAFVDVTPGNIFIQAGTNSSTAVFTESTIAHAAPASISHTVATAEQVINTAEIAHTVGASASHIVNASTVTAAVGSVASHAVSATAVLGTVGSAVSSVMSTVISHTLGAASSMVTAATAMLTAAGGSIAATAAGVSMTAGANSLGITSAGGTAITGAASLNGNPLVGGGYAIAEFGASGTFTTSSNSSASTVYRYRLVGGGGGGGGTNGAIAGGGGGGGGAYAEGSFTGVAASTAITITIGAAGAAGSTAGGSGGAGGTTTIGSPVSVSCAGGSGGAGSTSGSVGTVADGGAGGSTVTGSPIFHFTGSSGSFGVGVVSGVYALQGTGGGSGFGPGAGPLSSVQNGITATIPGGGGSGARGSGNAGGAGQIGIVLIERMTA